MADRYNLAKQLDSVKYYKTDSKGFDPKESFYNIEMVEKNGTRTDTGEHPASKLESVVGKELTKKILADEGIYVKHLGIGWNEWRYHWELWNHYHEWETTDMMDYVASGSEPGSVKGVEKKEVCRIEGGIGC